MTKKRCFNSGAEKINREKLFSIIILAFVLGSFASAKMWNMNINSNFKNNISVGNNQLGEIVLTRAYSNVTTYYFNSDFSNIAIDMNDKIINNASEILQSSGVTKNVFETFDTFSVPGNFTITGLSSNQTATVSVRAFENPMIDISFMSLPFNYTMPVHFLLDSDKILDFNLTIPDNAPPSTYNPIMTIKLNNVTKQNIQMPFSINKISLWEIEEIDLVNEIDAGKVGSAGNITFSNAGNAVSTVTINITGNISNILSPPTTTLVFPTTDTIVQLIYNLGTAIGTGNYSGTIFISGEGLNENKSIAINVKDIISPEITDIQIPSFMAGLARTIRVKVKDNLGIKKVSLIKIFNNTKEAETDFTKDQQTDWWRQDVTLIKPGDYTIIIKVIDTNDNIFYKNYSLPSLLENVVSYKEYYKLLTTKYNRWVVQEDIFSMNESIGLTVSVPEMTYAGNFSMALELPNKELRYFDKLPQGGFKSVTVTMPGDYNFMFKGDAISEYNGVMALSTDSPHVPFKNIIIVGDIKDFYVPPPYHASWYGGDVNCVVNDGGNPESSQTVCTLIYPGYVDVKENAIPVTTEFKTKTEKEYKDTLASLNKVIFNKNFIIGVLIFIMILLIIWFYYTVQIYPILNMKWR